MSDSISIYSVSSTSLDVSLSDCASTTVSLTFGIAPRSESLDVSLSSPIEWTFSPSFSGLPARTSLFTFLGTMRPGVPSEFAYFVVLHGVSSTRSVVLNYRGFANFAFLGVEIIKLL